MNKHVAALIELAPSDPQRETLYEIERKLDWMATTADAYFKDPEDGDDGTPHPTEERREPLPIAG
jgi:hypothetical protein